MSLLQFMQFRLILIDCLFISLLVNLFVIVHLLIEIRSLWRKKCNKLAEGSNISNHFGFVATVCSIFTQNI